MAREERSDAGQPAGPASRLEDLERRLDAAFRRLGGGGSAAASQGESLRARRARLHEQVRSGAGGTSVLGEIEALSDAIDQWVTHLDQSQAQHTRRTLR